METHFREWAIGIAMLITALVLSSYMAICQEQMYTNHGKYPREAMFYIVSICIVLTLFLLSSMRYHCQLLHLWA
jgi:Ca2+/Na+ antiporter